MFSTLNEVSLTAASPREHEPHCLFGRVGGQLNKLGPVPTACGWAGRPQGQMVREAPAHCTAELASLSMTQPLLQTAPRRLVSC